VLASVNKTRAQADNNSFWVINNQGELTLASNLTYTDFWSLGPIDQYNFTVGPDDGDLTGYILAYRVTSLGQNRLEEVKKFLSLYY